MNSNLIGVRDLIRGEFVLFAHAKNEAQFVRDTLPVVVRDMRIPLKDVQFVLIGSVDLETGTLSPLPHKIIPNDIYNWKAENEADPIPEDTLKKLKSTVETLGGN